MTVKALNFKKKEGGLNSFPNRTQKQLEKVLGYFFADPNLLKKALTHKSFVDLQQNKNFNNEKLEFLGDAVLQIVVSDILLNRHPEMNEGQLSKFRSTLVSEPGLVKIAEKLSLGEYLFMGKGENSSGGRGKKSILSDALEAVFGAIYIDSNRVLDPVKSVLQQLFEDEISQSNQIFDRLDYKTSLQEKVQKFLVGEVEYVLVSETGPDHQKLFESKLFVGRVYFGSGEGKSIKQSQQNAAKEGIQHLNKLIQ